MWKSYQAETRRSHKDELVGAPITVSKSALWSEPYGIRTLYLSRLLIWEHFCSRGKELFNHF